MKEAVRSVLSKLELAADDFVCDKAVQLHEVLQARHSVFVLGPPGAGKSECWKTLSSARGLLGSPVVMRVLNPKAVSVEELYGCMVLSTREWKDVRGGPPVAHA